ncbi:MAG: helix-turn-helix domain-containing protein [Microcoleaceae cyanobacterium]
MINLTYQFKLDLNRQQELEIENILEVCQSVYNYALAERKHWLRSRKSPVNSSFLRVHYTGRPALPKLSDTNQEFNRSQTLQKLISIQTNL